MSLVGYILLPKSLSFVKKIKIEMKKKERTFGVGAAVNVGEDVVGEAVGEEVPILSNLLGEPEPGFVTLLSTALFSSFASTSDGDKLLFALRYKAVTPHTCGDAIEVPEIVL